MRAVTAYPARGRISGKKHRATLPLMKPSLRVLTSNCSIAFDTVQVSNCSKDCSVSLLSVFCEGFKRLPFWQFARTIVNVRPNARLCHSLRT